MSIIEEYKAGKRDFRGANLRGANLRAADLSAANLSAADLSAADLSAANLRAADLSGADLRGANLRAADLRAADLRAANLSGANLSVAQGLLDPIAWLEEHFEKDDQGVIVYKIFGLHYAKPERWEIAPGSIITEVVNPCPGSDCACGVNVATLDWIRKEASYPATIWKCRIRWSWLAGVVVPYHTDGKIRTTRLELLEIMEVQ